jgi:antitoxin component YwqK of YwqJK toxin-antitoxin module
LYKGLFKDGKPHGIGFLYLSSEIKYFGQMKNGQRHGLATVYIAK